MARTKPMSVADLVRQLLTYPQELPVCYKLHSEQCLLRPEDIKVQDLCAARSDDWVHNKRPDKKSIPYLVLPGN